ncbi:MerR family transcriptional regulator [Actinomyces faecalis]|uniref:MerR family transcriptional regulator n=1 Tax=Actinomyces faecalis TaxID=2722820 RepID=UPI00155648FD|nr:helix-turn-helix domain-containing protein [Actinomyces faecalis]
MSTSVTLYTTAEVADLAGVDTSTVRRWVERKQLVPAAITPGGHYRFDPDDVTESLGMRPQMRSRAAGEVA